MFFYHLIQALRGKGLAAGTKDVTLLALVDYLQRPLDMTAVLLRLLTTLQDRWQQLGRTGFPPQAPQFRRRCILDGRTIQVSTGRRLLTGRCLGIDDSGSLVLQTESGREEVASGSVVKMESPA